MFGILFGVCLYVNIGVLSSLLWDLCILALDVSLQWLLIHFTFCLPLVEAEPFVVNCYCNFTFCYIDAFEWLF